MEIVFSDIDHLKKTNFYFLKEMCVTPSMQRQGIGKAMIAQLKKRLKEKQVSRIYLITHRKSASSMFYSSLSFEENPSIMVMGLQIDGR